MYGCGKFKKFILILKIGYLNLQGFEHIFPCTENYV